VTKKKSNTAIKEILTISSFLRKNYRVDDPVLFVRIEAASAPKNITGAVMEDLLKRPAMTIVTTMKTILKATASSPVTRNSGLSLILSELPLQ